MSASINIREGRPDDAGYLVRSLQNISEAERSALSLPPPSDFSSPLRAWVDKALATPAALVLVAEVDGEAAGMLMGEAEWLPNPMSLWQKRAVIQAVWVEPEHRRQGIAKRLVATFEEALAPYNIPYCDMAYAPGNEAAQRFWERLGFRAAEIHGRKLYVAEGDSPEDAARGS